MKQRKRTGSKLLTVFLAVCMCLSILPVSVSAEEGYDVIAGGAERPSDDPVQAPADPSIPDDFENDLWLQYDFKEMKVGDTADIYPRRIPQIISSAITNDVYRPNFNFDILSGDSIKLDTTDSTEKANVTAVKPGVTIVKVTYDETDYNNKSFGANAACNAAYAVFAVTEADFGKTGITITPNTEIQPGLPLTSYDTIYYTNGSTVDYKFTPTIEGADTVRVTCNGHVIEKINGRYILPLENRSNIIGVTAVNENGARYFYKVIDARKIRINVENKTNPGEQLKAGDTANISFIGIANPVHKLATIYNPTWYAPNSAWGPTYGTYVEYTNRMLSDETFRGVCNQWDLATKNDFDVTFDEAGSFTFSDGKISSEWWGKPLGYDKGVYGQEDPDLAAPVMHRIFCDLPDFTVTVAEASEENRVNLQDAYETTGNYLLTHVTNPTVGSVAGEWSVLGLARSDFALTDSYMDAYYEQVVQYVTENINEREQLHRAKSTDNSRVIAALTSIGKDPADVGGHNLLAGLTDMNYLKKQGNNGPIWALIAFDTNNYEIPVLEGDGIQVTREGLIEYILSQQLENGAWSLSGSAPNLDITAMTLYALAPYVEKDEAVKAAVEKSVNYLSGQQSDNGSFAYGNQGSNAESCAQVITALSALGIDAASDARFVKGEEGRSLLEAFLEFYVEGGGFRHVMDGELDLMATEQAFYTMVAYNRFRNGENRLFDMTDVGAEDPGEPEEPTDPGEPEEPTDPGEPEEPTDPSEPTNPSESVNPSEPTDPSEPLNPSEPTNPPKTGDESYAGMWLLLLILSGMGMAALTVAYRKKQYK